MFYNPLFCKNCCLLNSRFAFAHVDVIGVITAISPVKAIRVPHTLRQVFKRHVLLSNHKNVLWFLIFMYCFIFYWPFFIAAHPIGTLLFSYYFSGNVLGITLWGERAIRFNGESVHFMGQTKPAVVIFVGVTVFVNEGSLRNRLMDWCTSFLLFLCVWRLWHLP